MYTIIRKLRTHICSQSAGLLAAAPSIISYLVEDARWGEMDFVVGPDGIVHSSMETAMGQRNNTISASSPRIEREREGTSVQSAHGKVAGVSKVGSRVGGDHASTFRGSILTSTQHGPKPNRTLMYAC